jgi:hypothetical protein
MTRPTLVTWSLVAAVCATACAQTAAQSPPAGVVPPAHQPVLDNATLMTKAYEPLVTPRPASEIDADMEEARNDEKQAREEQQRVQSMREVANAKIEVMKRDRESISQRIDLAKKGGMEAEKKTLEAQKKAHELQLDVLERDREVKRTHVEVAKHEIEEAQARQRLFEVERELVDKRSELERAALPEGASVEAAEKVVKLHHEARELERRVLEAMRTRSDKAIAAAQAKKSYAERQLGLHKAQVKALAGR